MILLGAGPLAWCLALWLSPPGIYFSYCIIRWHKQSSLGKMFRDNELCMLNIIKDRY